MVFNASDWTTVISVAAGAAVTITSLWKKLEKKDPELAKEVPHAVRTVLDDGEHLVADLMKSPWFAAEAAKGKVEVHHITDKIKKAVIGQYAAQMLAAFGKELADLTNIQRATLLSDLQSRLKLLGVNVTPSELTGYLEQVQNSIAALQSTVVKAAANLDEVLSQADPTAEEQTKNTNAKENA
jgi:hypothetical protein